MPSLSGFEGFFEKYVPVFLAGKILENVRVQIVEDARCRGINAISLEATRMGRPLYEKFGFVKMSDEMEYPC